MTVAELRVAVESVLGTVPFSPPVSIAYCQSVVDALHTAVPGAKVEAYHRIKDLVVEARLGKAEYKLVVPLG